MPATKQINSYAKHVHAPMILDQIKLLADGTDKNLESSKHPQRRPSYPWDDNKL